MRKIWIVALFTAILLAMPLSGCGSSHSLSFTKKAPIAPTGLSGQANSSSSIIVNWSDVSDNEAGFKVYRNGVVVDSFGANVTSFTDRGLQYGTTYTYIVSAYNDIGETKSASAQFKTLNPPIVITLDRIGVVNDHDPFLKGEGEIYAYVAVSDGNVQPQITRIPSSQTINLNDNESTDISQRIFSTDSVGDELKIVAIGFESDDPVLGMAGNLLIQGMKAYLTVQYGQAGQLVGTLIKSQVSQSDEGAPLQLAESTSDDFVGAVEKAYSLSNNWGIGSYQDVTSGDLRLWFTISLVTEAGLTPKPPTPLPVVTPTSSNTSTPSTTVKPLTVNFGGWYVNGVNVTTTTKNKTVVARLSMTGGSAGQYKMRIRRDISFGDDTTVNETLFNYDWTSIIKELSFIPPYATNEASTNGYHVDLIKDTNSLFTLSNAYPPRLRVNP